jgi:hypothetical protein
MMYKATSRGITAFLLFNLFFASQIAVYARGIQDQDDKQYAQPEQNVSGQTGMAVIETAPVPETRILLRSDPSEKPEWVDTVPQSETEFFFIGTSQPFDTAANARDNARENARNQVLRFYGEFIESRAIARTSISGSTRDTLESYVNREDEIRSFAQNVISQIGTDRYYTEVYINSNNKEEYIVYTLCQIGRQRAEDDITNFAKNISERYVNLLPQRTTLRAMLEGYAFVAKSLEQNPLHRITAYFETSAGRVGLYEYTRLQINELADSVSVEAIPARTIQETENLTTRINLRSAILPATGLLDCQASIFGIGSDDIVYPFKTAGEDPYNLQIRNIKPGSYNVTIEILLSDLTGGIAKNTGGGFSFDVRPLNVILDNPAAIEAGIKRAVDTLATRLQTQTETIIGPFTMTGTDIPSELSIYLTEKVTHYAKNNQERKYRVMEGGIEQAAVFSGFFTKRNDKVDVTFELTTPNRDRDGSYIFSISVDVLENIIGIAVEPENVTNMIILDEVVPAPATETIHIEARLNSNTRTYKHRDEL